MANALFDKAREKFLTKLLDWAGDDIKVALVTAGYTPNLATHEFHSSIGGGNIVATTANLSGKTTAAGIADAANVTLTAVTGSAVTQLVIYKDTGVSATSPLIALIDSATNLPVTPNGGDITIAWDNATNKIFKL